MQQDPTDIGNLSVDAVGERKAIQAAYAAASEQAAKQAKKPPPKPEPPKIVKPAPAKPVQMKPEPPPEQLKTPLLDQVIRYRERFPQLKSRNRNLTVKSSMAEFEDELHYIEQQLGAEINAPGQTGKLGNVGFIAAMSGLEYATDIWNPLGLKLQGLGTTTAASISTFEPLLDELIIKHGLDMTASVEWRLAMLVGSTVLTVHMANADDPAGKQLLAKLADAGKPKKIDPSAAKDL